MTKMSGRKFKYLNNEKSFSYEIKAIFKGLSAARNCLDLNMGIKFLL